MEECVIKVSNLPSSFFSTHNWLTDWLGRKHGTLLKGDGVSWKGSLKGAKHWKFTFFFFFFPNNIFIITTLHLLPLLQISCWKKQRHTKDPGESWDSALIGKPFNIWKYNLTFLSIEEPLRGRAGGGDMLSSHRNLPAHANKRVLSPVFILFSLISPRLLGPHTPAQSRHHKSTCVCVWSTAPGEESKSLESPPQGLHTPTAAGKNPSAALGRGTLLPPCSPHQALAVAQQVLEPWLPKDQAQSHNWDTANEPGRGTLPR